MGMISILDELSDQFKNNVTKLYQHMIQVWHCYPCVCKRAFGQLKTQFWWFLIYSILCRADGMRIKSFANCLDLYWISFHLLLLQNAPSTKELNKSCCEIWTPRVICSSSSSSKCIFSHFSPDFSGFAKEVPPDLWLGKEMHFSCQVTNFYS